MSISYSAINITLASYSPLSQRPTLSASATDHELPFQPASHSLHLRKKHSEHTVFNINTLSHFMLRSIQVYWVCAGACAQGEGDVCVHAGVCSLRNRPFCVYLASVFVPYRSVGRAWPGTSTKRLLCRLRGV